MSANASCRSVSQGATVASLLAGRLWQRPSVRDDGGRLQDAALQLLEQQQDLDALLREVTTLDPAACADVSAAGSLLVCELRREAARRGVPVPVLAVKTTLDRLMEITAAGGDERRELLTSCQRVQLSVLLESSRELLSHGVLCPKLLWQEYRRSQRLPNLEVVYHLHGFSILPLKYILESDEGLRLWFTSQLKALSCWTPPPQEEDTQQVQHKVLSTLVGVLVGSGFEPSCDPDSRISPLSRSVLDEMLFWLLDTVDTSVTLKTAAGPGAELWIQLFDASLCGVSASAEAVQRFFTHSLTQTLTYKPRLTVSDAVTVQNEWTFAKASRLLTSLYRKLCVTFSWDQTLRLLQQLLETHEVNWKHVLCFLSTLLVYNPGAQSSLRELLSRLLSSAFEAYDLEHMITVFLLARQGALEGAAIFCSYAHWFKMSFGGSSGPHAASKKSLVFLLKFLSDLVPFEPPQYLKVHILHPPFVPVKHRSLLMEYISLAKTRLADLKESVEDMGLYEDISAAGGASLQPQCQALQDVEKAVSLFDSTGKISATVMEASIFRRPYFLTRFLPALLTPRVLPVKADALMSLIEALRKAEKIPAAQHSAYLESCQKQRRQDERAVCLDTGDDPLDVLSVQLQDFRRLVVDGNEEETCPQLSRISHTLSVLFPGRHDDLQQTIIKVHVDTPLSPEVHVKVINMILRNFCQCMLDASRANPPNKQSPWASRFVGVLLGNRQLLSGIIHRLWDLFHNQASSLSSAHSLGLAAFAVHLHASVSHSPLVQLSVRSKPLPVGDALGLALACRTRSDMLFCVRFCVAAVCYGFCRGDSQEVIISSFYKKLLYLVPRLLPEARRSPAPPAGLQEEEELSGLWSSASDSGCSWRRTAVSLWRRAAFQQLRETPENQMLLCDWLQNELRIQRSEDALTDPERQEYQQWACLELFWPRPEEQGGCGGDMKLLCRRLLDAIMDQELCLDKLPHGASATGSCLPDILSRLQEFVSEMQMSRTDTCDFLFDSLTQRCSSNDGVSSELSLQHTVNAWNRALLALPPQLCVQVKTEGGRTRLDCSKVMDHINQYQRKACSPAGLLSLRLTAHFLRGVLCGSVGCTRPREEVNQAWSQISVRCPLLLTSAVHWWPRVCPVLTSLWSRVCDGETPPEQLQLISDCQLWANSVVSGSWSPPAPGAPPLLLASSLHRACGPWSFRVDTPRPEGGTQDRQVLVYLFSLSVNEYLWTLLYPQERKNENLISFCSDLLRVLADSSDWLLVFKSGGERGVYQPVTMVTSDELTRLMPWAFFSLLLHQSPQLLHRVVRCPGFLLSAVLSYVSLLGLFLDGLAPAASDRQPEPRQILSGTKRFLLSAIAQTSPAALTSAQLARLESECADVDPEVAAALRVHSAAPSLSPEMDFL